MKSIIALSLMYLAWPTVGITQTPDTVSDVEARKKTLRFIAGLEAPKGGYRVDANAKPSYRAINGAIRAWKYLGGEQLGSPFPNKAVHLAFLKAAYDPQTGAFAEPDTRPDVASTAVGILTAVELGLSESDYPKALDYLRANAKTFEDVRISAAALEAVKKKPDWISDWYAIADTHIKRVKDAPAVEDSARNMGGWAAMRLRLGDQLPMGNTVLETLNAGQRTDGGYGKGNTKSSDLESTYRVMRTYHLLKQKPKNTDGLKAFVEKCQNKDGGFGVELGKPSTLSGVYYAVIIKHWLKDGL